MGTVINITDQSYGDWLRDRVIVWNRNNDLKAERGQAPVMVEEWEVGETADLNDPEYGVYLNRQAGYWNGYHGFPPMEEGNGDDSDESQ